MQFNVALDRFYARDVLFDGADTHRVIELVDRLLKAESPNKNHKITFTQIVPRENSPLLNFILMWVLPGLIVTGGLKPGEGIVPQGAGLVREGTQVK